MSKKLPPEEAFTLYVSLGDDRSYQKVARKYGASKRSVAKRAAKDNWQARLEEIRRKAWQETDRKAAESVDAMNQRHLKFMRAIQGKALEALKSMPLDTGMNAIRALDLAVRGERLIRGEPSERTGGELTVVVRYVNAWREKSARVVTGGPAAQPQPASKPSQDEG